LKTVGITQRVMVDPKHGERRDALDQRWPRFLAAVGVVGIPLPNRPELAVRIASELELAGLVLTGGNDLAAYGGDAPERDATDAVLMDWARGCAAPVMGVCRGMQLILHGFGAKLERAQGHVTASHEVLIDGEARHVNSYHHFIVRKPVAALRVWGTAWDGSIEAIRHEREPILGVMWHPERADPFDARDVAMFRSLFGVKA
jgi:putative glutamine amidotransferase